MSTNNADDTARQLRLIAFYLTQFTPPRKTMNSGDAASPSVPISLMASLLPQALPILPNILNFAACAYP